MNESNSSEQASNNLDDSLKMSVSSQNPIEHIEILNVFPSDRLIYEHERMELPNPHSSTPSPASEQQKKHKASEDEEKHKNYIKNEENTALQNPVQSNVVKIRIPPESKDTKMPPDKPKTKKRKRKKQETLKKETDLEIDKEKEPPVDQRIYTCTNCKKTYKKNHDLKSHMRKHVLFFFILINEIDWREAL
jgi:hypothetical protein